VTNVFLQLKGVYRNAMVERQGVLLNLLYYFLKELYILYYIIIIFL